VVYRTILTKLLAVKSANRILLREGGKMKKNCDVILMTYFGGVILMMSLLCDF